MKQFTIEATTTGRTSYMCIDRRGNAGDNKLIIVDMEGGDGVVTFEFTPDDCIDSDGNEIWIEHDVLNTISGSCASTINIPFQAFRLNVLELKSGTIKARVVQGGYHDY